MTGKRSIAVFLLLSCTVVGCTSVPRALYHKGRTVTHAIGRDIRQGDEEKWDVSVGRISVSTPLFRPVHEAKATDKGPLDFEKKKTIPELYEALQKSGVDIANLQAHLRQIEIAAALQGPLTTTTSSFETSTAASLAANLGFSSEATGGVDPAVNDVAALEKILQNLLASDTFTATADGSGAFKTSVGESEKSTTVDSPPGVPQTLPSLITLPEAIASKMTALLGSSEVDKVVPQADLASLAGSLSVHMTNMEQFYNPGMWVQDFREIGQEWKAYQVNFNVTVEPGWYTQLNQYDAVAEVKFDLRLREQADLGVRP
jgi:hypothetical protein